MLLEALDLIVDPAGMKQAAVPVIVVIIIGLWPTPVE
jgi:hypothetical protein